MHTMEESILEMPVDTISMRKTILHKATNSKLYHLPKGMEGSWLLLNLILKNWLTVNMLMKLIVIKDKWGKVHTIKDNLKCIMLKMDTTCLNNNNHISDNIYLLDQ